MHIEPHHTAFIAEAPGCTTRAVQERVARYNRGSTDALADRPGRGRKAKLPPADADRFRHRIPAGPTPEVGVGAFHAWPGHPTHPPRGVRRGPLATGGPTTPCVASA